MNNFKFHPNFLRTTYLFFLTEKRATGGILITGKLVTETTFLPPDNKIWGKKIITCPKQIRSEKERKKICR